MQPIISLNLSTSFSHGKETLKFKKNNYSTYFYELSRLSEKATVMLKKDNCVQLSIAFVKEFRYIQIQLKIS